jgi:hypothetical protein
MSSVRGVLFDYTVEATHAEVFFTKCLIGLMMNGTTCVIWSCQINKSQWWVNLEAPFICSGSCWMLTRHFIFIAAEFIYLVIASNVFFPFVPSKTRHISLCTHSFPLQMMLHLLRHFECRLLQELLAYLIYRLLNCRCQVLGVEAWCALVEILRIDWWDRTYLMLFHVLFSFRVA